MNSLLLKRLLMKAIFLKTLISFCVMLIMIPASAEPAKPQKPSYLSAEKDEFLNELEIAANQGDVNAQMMMGAIYFRGIPGFNSQPPVQKDMELGKAWFMKAIDSGGGLCAMALLGYSYEQNAMVTDNYDEAVYWYRQVAEKGGTDSQIALLNLYEKGLYTPQDNLEIPRWLLNTAKFGVVKSRAKAADLYLDGQIVGRDLVQAYKWISLAISSNPNDGELIKKRQDIAAQLSDRQLGIAQKLIKTWKPKRHSECEKFAELVR